MIGGVLFALLWSQYISPVGGLAGAVVCVYLGAIPASAAFFASLSEFDLWGLAVVALRWRRHDARFVPGPGGSATGYVVIASEAAVAPDDERWAGFDLEALWE